MVTRIAFLFLVACTASPPARIDARPADINTVSVIDGPTSQMLTVPSYDYPYGEINIIDIGGVVPSWPADLFAQVTRVHAVADCSSHDQRSGAAAFENATTKQPGDTHTLVNVGAEFSAENGDYNLALEVLKGDAQIDHGSLALNEGNVFAGGGFVAGQTLYTEGPGGVVFATGGALASIRVVAGPPTDAPPKGSLVIDTATPALWMWDGATWRQAAFAP